MLVLSRKLGERIIIGDGIVVQVLEVQGAGRRAKVRLGVIAPREVVVMREELLAQPPDQPPPKQ